MKTILTSLVLASASAFAQQAAPEATLKPGSEVSLEPLAAAKWIQGEAPKSFEPGKIYMFECWATWCGPCVAAIPHVNELHKKYYDKGLRVFGMNVWEDGVEKVEKFVKAKGDGMSYPVAYTGKGSVFENEWLRPAGVRGIPHAFIVKDGKIVLTSHPSQLTDAVIEALLSGDEGAEKAVAKLNTVKENRGKISALMGEIRKAGSANDAITMAAKIEELEKLDANSPYLPAIKLDLLIVQKDWPAATKAIEEMPDGPGKRMAVMMTANKIGSRADTEYPVDFIQAVSKSFASLLDDPKMPPSPMAFVNLSILQWKSDDKEAALASAKNASAAAGKQPKGRSLPAAPFERFAKSVEDGTLPTMAEFSGWVGEAMKKSSNKAKTEPVPAKE